jgi:hypothetical protein
MSTEYRLAEALRKARSLVDLGLSPFTAARSELIPEDLRSKVEEVLAAESSFVLAPIPVITARRTSESWLAGVSREGWYYWPTMRQHLLSQKSWSLHAVRSIDDVSDRVLEELSDPHGCPFDKRGLVVGHVQSGKTANYAALLAKAADLGYRLIIVLSGVDNALRRQTNARLRQELVGSATDPSAVRLPPHGKQWHEFTSDELDGDFRPGHANHAALQGPQPVLMVIKKNVMTLRRLLEWLSSAPSEILAEIPALVIDDEADQASVDTRGSYSNADPAEGYEEPAVINGLIRDLLNKFSRRVYVAYTATPSANVFIPHDSNDPFRGNDLYPRDFIVPLPRPEGYMGAEELFGRPDDPSGGDTVDPVVEIPSGDPEKVFSGLPAPSLVASIRDFILTGAARASRGHDHLPATMLVHASQRKSDHRDLHKLVDGVFADLRDDWRYMRELSLLPLLRERWSASFRDSARALGQPFEFSDIEPHIGRFMESVKIKTINSETGDVLDYKAEPSLKAIAIGGNRLSRGLTLEGLTVSYFVRRTLASDTLLQMARWFGFRPGYSDLVRVWTTRELAAAFADLAFMEESLRQDLRVYEETGMTPAEVAPRVWYRQSLQPTNRPKRRYAKTVLSSPGFDGSLHQTYRFPLDNQPLLTSSAADNIVTVRRLVASMPAPSLHLPEGPLWLNVQPDTVREFLSDFKVYEKNESFPSRDMVEYIKGRVESGSLARWTVAVRGRKTADSQLGTADWGLGCRPNQITRTRLKRTESLGVITNPDDELAGLSAELEAEARRMVTEGLASTLNNAARRLRSPEEALLLIYPISRHSGCGLKPGSTRSPLYDDPNAPDARDLIAIAVSFPSPSVPPRREKYMVGTPGWREPS